MGTDKRILSKLSTLSMMLIRIRSTRYAADQAPALGPILDNCEFALVEVRRLVALRPAKQRLGQRVTNFFVDMQLLRLLKKQEAQLLKMLDLAKEYE